MINHALTLPVRAWIDIILPKYTRLFAVFLLVLGLLLTIEYFPAN